MANYRRESNVGDWAALFDTLHQAYTDMKRLDVQRQLEELKKTPAQFGMKRKKGWLERYKKGVARKEARITRTEASLNRQIEKVKSPLIDLDSIYSRVGITPTKTFDRLTRED